MGLLDWGNWNEDPVKNESINRGLLSTGLALLNSRGSFGQALGQAGQIGLDEQQKSFVLGQNDKFKTAERLRREMELKILADQQAKAAAAEQEQARISGIVRQQYTPISGTDVAARTGMTGPTPAAAAQIGTMPAVDYRAMLAAGVPFNVVKQMEEAQNLGKAEVARTAEVDGPNGEKLIQAFDKFNSPVGPPVPAYMTPVQVNRGGSVDFVRPKPGMSLPVGMSPAEIAANSRGIESNRIARERLDLEKTPTVGVDGAPNQVALERVFGKPEPGMRWKPNGTSEMIPGGKVERETKVNAEKAARGGREAISTIDAMLKHPGLDTAVGLSGQIAPSNYIWGSDALGARALIEQVQGKAFLQAFESLKGAGQITQIEGEKATAAITRLQRYQSDEDFKAAAAEFRGVLANGVARSENRLVDTPDGKAIVFPNAQSAQQFRQQMGL
jgi:hypothetical protein